MEENKNNNQAKRKNKIEVNNKKRLSIFSIIVVLIIVIFVVIFLSQRIVKKDSNTNDLVENEGKFVEVQDGTKVNTSSKMKEERAVDGLEFSNIEMNYKEGITTILANVKNTTDSTVNDLTLDIKVVDENQQEIKTIMAYIYELGPQETTQISTSINLDIVDSYDIIITKSQVTNEE